MTSGKISLEQARELYIKAENIYQLNTLAIWFDIEDEEKYVFTQEGGSHIYTYDIRDNNSVRTRTIRMHGSRITAIRENGIDITKLLALKG